MCPPKTSELSLPEGSDCYVIYVDSTERPVHTCKARGLPQHSNLLLRSRNQGMQRRTPFPLLLIALFMLIALSACALPTGRVAEPLSPQEQLLLSTALKTSLHEKQSGIPEGRSVTLTASSLRIDAA